MANPILSRLVFGNADNYIKSINPTANRVVDSMPLRFGDMEGMAPKTAKVIGEKDGVKYMQDGDDFYAMAVNPNTNEMDVVGYHLAKDGASDLQVVEEMRGKGVGGELSYLFRKNNPEAPTGGLTEAGEKTARKAYERLKNEGILGAGILGALGLPENATAADLVMAGKEVPKEQARAETQQMILDALLGFMAPTPLGDATMDAYNRNRIR